MTDLNKRYEYTGNVMAFGKVIDRNVTLRTWAPTKRKAISNLKHRCKYLYNLNSRVVIDLDEKKIKEG